jgi:hypothetical protein
VIIPGVIAVEFTPCKDVTGCAHCMLAEGSTHYNADRDRRSGECLNR